MDESPAASYRAPPAPTKQIPPRWLRRVEAVQAARRDPQAQRVRRVWLLLAFVWMVNGFDLVLTVLAHSLGGFHELNPIARPLLSSTAALVAYKSALVAAPSAVLLLYRRRAATEITCWLAAALYAALAFRWLAYFDGLS